MSASFAIMSNLFPAPLAHPYGAGVSQMPMSQSQEGIPLQSLGVNTTNTHPQFLPRQPSLPLFHGGETPLSIPTDGSLPQQIEDHPQPCAETPSATMVSHAPDYNHTAKEFNGYNPLQKPEVRSNRGQPKHSTPAPSPDGAPSSTGRRRTRTKVVAWDPRDLEDIYERKEIKKEDWAKICKVYLLT